MHPGTQAPVNAGNGVPTSLVPVVRTAQDATVLSSTRHAGLGGPITALRPSSTLLVSGSEVSHNPTHLAGNHPTPYTADNDGHVVAHAIAVRHEGDAGSTTAANSYSGPRSLQFTPPAPFGLCGMENSRGPAYAVTTQSGMQQLPLPTSLPTAGHADLATINATTVPGLNVASAAHMRPPPPTSSSNLPAATTVEPMKESPPGILDAYFRQHPLIHSRNGELRVSQGSLARPNEATAHCANAPQPASPNSARVAAQVAQHLPMGSGGQPAAIPDARRGVSGYPPPPASAQDNYSISGVQNVGRVPGGDPPSPTSAQGPSHPTFDGFEPTSDRKVYQIQQPRASMPASVAGPSPSFPLGNNGSTSLGVQRQDPVPGGSQGVGSSNRSLQRRDPVPGGSQGVGSSEANRLEMYVCPVHLFREWT